MQRWYQRLTIYAFTSRNEGFGLTLIEAMSSGAALVAARAGAAEFVVEDGVTGVLTPPGDVDALVAALEPLMRDPASANAMGERARERVVQKFSLDAEANAIAAVYQHAGLSHHLRDEGIEIAACKQEAWEAPRPAPPRYRSARSPMTKLPSCRTGQCCIRSWIMPGRGFRQG